MSGSIYILPPMPGGEKPFGLELELNPSPLASQATAQTTRPCRLGQFLNSDKILQLPNLRVTSTLKM